MKLNILCCAGLLSLPLTAMAIDSGPNSPYQQETESWLMLQNRNIVASRTPQYATSSERNLSLQRWLNSFIGDPIPEFYDQKMGGDMSTGK
jgi:hypothetical protein